MTIPHKAQTIAAFMRSCSSRSVVADVASWFLIGFLILLVGIAYLESVPPIWWDEGWTVSVARNWVETGHYGRMSLGEKAPHGLQAAFPVTMSVALAFNFFGVGIFQARSVVLLYLLGTFALLFYFGSRFFNRRIAVGAVLVLLLMSGNRYMHPIFMARQVLGEVPALFFLLLGYLCFLWSGERSRMFLIGAVLFWSLAIVTKVQVIPFWAISLSVPLIAAAFARDWVRLMMFTTGLFGVALLSYSVWQSLEQLLIATPASGLYQTIGIVVDPARRVITVLTTLQIGLPTLMGLVWALRNLKLNRMFETHISAVLVSYFIVCGTWFAWWELASTGWTRYLFPSAFLASIFVSAMLYECTDGFRILESLRKAIRNIASTNLKWREVRVIALMLLVSWSIFQTVTDLGEALRKTNKPLFATAEYLNRNTPSYSVIETYESELFFLLQRRYHYPPDQVHVELIRREDLGEARVIDYDPLSADPDYLVIGGWCRYYKCYDSVLSNGAFRLTNTFGPYEIYERVRDNARPSKAAGTSQF